MVFADSLARPSGNGLPDSQRKHQPHKNFSHSLRLQPLSQPPAKNASDKDPWDQEQPGLPGNIPRLGIREKRQRACRWYQRNQTGPLRAMLPKSKKQRQEWNKESAAPDTEKPRSYPAEARRSKNARVTHRTLNHGLTPHRWRAASGAPPAVFAKVKTQPGSENNRITL